MLRIILTISILLTLYVSINVKAQGMDQKETIKLGLELKMASIENNFVVIGHRGAAAYFPENTIPSFLGAIELKADMLELDVQLTKDNIPVVFHDTKLDKRSNGRGLVADYTLSELQQLDAGLWFGSQFKGEKIPTLREVLELIKGRILINIEIKTEAVLADADYNPETSVEQQVVDMVNELGIKDEVMVSSFDYRAVKRVKEIDREIYTGLLYDKAQSKGLNPKQLVDLYAADAFNCSARLLSKSWIKLLNENNIPFFVYTINRKRQMRKVINAGAKGIFSDKPDVLKEVSDKLLQDI